MEPGDLACWGLLGRADWPTWHLQAVGLVQALQLVGLVRALQAVGLVRALQVVVG